MKKFDRTYLRYIRYFIQWYIVFFLLYSGYKFYVFVEYFNSKLGEGYSAGIS